jgi:FAD:protein FMN transferase
LRWADATFSTYRSDSAISRLNAGTLALGDAAPEVHEVLERCEALRARTRGCFDVRARGDLNPSGFVKGWAVEVVATMLVAAGARNLCVHAGRRRARARRAGSRAAVAREDPAPLATRPRGGRAAHARPRGGDALTILADGRVLSTPGVAPLGADGDPWPPAAIDGQTA